MLDAPHSKMNKFIGPSDTNFGLVSNAIKKMVEQAKSIALSQREGNDWSFFANARVYPGLALTFSKLIDFTTNIS